MQIDCAQDVDFAMGIEKVEIRQCFVPLSFSVSLARLERKIYANPSTECLGCRGRS